MLTNILMAVFAVSMIVNAVILYNNYIIMRVLIVQLAGFVEQTKMFNEAVDTEQQRRTGIVPEK